MLWVVETDEQLLCATGCVMSKSYSGDTLFLCHANSVSLDVFCKLWLWRWQSALSCLSCVSCVLSTLCVSVCFMSGSWNGVTLLLGVLSSFKALCVWLCFFFLWVVNVMATKVLVPCELHASLSRIVWWYISIVKIKCFCSLLTVGVSVCFRAAVVMLTKCYCSVNRCVSLAVCLNSFMCLWVCVLS